MTDQQDALRAAQWAVKHAQQLEEDGEERAAEDYWREAEREYEDAGVDADWFDHAELVGSLDETPAPMKAFWLFPTTAVEITYEPGDEEPSGLVCDVRDLETVEP